MERRTCSSFQAPSFTPIHPLTSTTGGDLQGGNPAKKIHLLLRTVEREASGLKHKLERAGGIADKAAELDRRAQELKHVLDD